MTKYLSSENSHNLPGKGGILAIEVIGRGGSIAIWDKNGPMLSRPITDDSVTSQAPRAAAAITTAIEGLLRDHAGERDPCKSLQSVAVAVGPGSFTGLRIAVTTAKTFAYAMKIPVIMVDSLAAIAMSIPATDAKIRVGLTAYRGQVFRAGFTQAPKVWLETDIVSGSTWQAELTESLDQTSDAGKEIWVGNRSVFEKALSKSAKADAAQKAMDTRFREPPNPWAEGVVRLAAMTQTACPPNESIARKVNPMDAMPKYLRESAAEEKANEQTA